MSGLGYETGGITGPPSATGQFTWRAAYKVEVRWEWTKGGFTLDQSLLDGSDVIADATTDGYFMLGVSQLDLSDVLAPGALYIPGFTGPYDNLSQPSDPTWPTRLETLTWSRGRDADLQNIDSGKTTITVVDKKGLLNPKNDASPLSAFTRKPMRPIRISTHLPWEPDGTWRTCFFGYTRTLDYDPVERRATISAEDLLLRLQRYPTPTVSLTNTTTGAAITRLLDEIGWSDDTFRSIDTGDTIATFAPAADQNVLQTIEDLLATEFGLFWVKGDGTATFESRLSRPQKAVTRMLSDEMHALGPGSDLDKVVNEATFTANGGPEQKWTDAISADPVRGYGLNAASTVDSTYLANDRQALQRAQYIVQLRKDPVGPVWRLGVDNRTREQLEMAALTEVSDLIEVSEALTGTAGQFFVERVERSVNWPNGGPPTDQATYVLSERTHSSFQLDTSTLNGAALLEL